MLRCSLILTSSLSISGPDVVERSAATCTVRTRFRGRRFGLLETERVGNEARCAWPFGSVADVIEECVTLTRGVMQSNFVRVAPRRGVCALV